MLVFSTHVSCSAKTDLCCCSSSWRLVCWEVQRLRYNYIVINQRLDMHLKHIYRQWRYEIIPQLAAVAFLLPTKTITNVLMFYIYIYIWESVELDNAYCTLISLSYSILAAASSAFWSSKCVLLWSSPVNRSFTNTVIKKLYKIL